ncbi:hypothetical protein JX265_010121 [Neoarthrinium moseri]|uniref:Uncharacterized protein n=1 Tax=Neoarthrinium moseri TaxID=1658444 RepID=A0A9P9WF95_9PEZI|nr:hypothetical protein JX265_010121 [Neoarthrinium moseri]
MYLKVLPIRYQSNVDSFGDWVSLLTLCFAPLIAHVFAGAPRPSYLVRTRPSWLDQICLFNPTSIIFRYGAIVERRIGTTQWTPLDAAATNALFWTQRGWDGSKAMMANCAPYCTLSPEAARTRIFSVEMLKTVITTIQGIQALVSLVEGQLGTSQVLQVVALDSMFGPLAIIGLLRLLPGLWLTEDFVFSSKDEPETSEINGHVAGGARGSVDSLLLTQEPWNGAAQHSRFRPSSHWANRLFQVFYLLLLLGLWVLAGSWTFFHDRWITTATSFVGGTFYFALLAATIAIYAYYLVRGQTDSTIIPCASHWWYKAYSIMVVLSMATLVVVSALETVKTACGVYTSTPLKSADWMCAVGPRVQTIVEVDSTSVVDKSFGIAMKEDWGRNHTDLALGVGEFWVANFTGTCLGRWQEAPIQRHASTLGFADYTNVTGKPFF